MKSRDAARWVAGFALVDLLFLRWVYLHFGHWGFWDWHYQLTLLEAARLAVVEQRVRRHEIAAKRNTANPSRPKFWSASSRIARKRREPRTRRVMESGRRTPKSGRTRGYLDGPSACAPTR